MALTDVKIRSAKAESKPYKLSDGGGLFLLVGASSKLWRWKFRLDGKENLLALGRYPEVGLAEARRARDAARALVDQGVNPAGHKRAERAKRSLENANTFEAVAREWVSKQRTNWSPYYLKQVEAFLGNDVYPKVGALPIRDVTAAQVLEILQTIEARGAETVALMVRQWVSAVFRYAVATLRADGDPAAALRGAITRPKVQHRKQLGRDDIPRLISALESYGGYRTTIIAMRLLMYTFVRPGEMRAASWGEFDLQRAEWRIPAERMKMREAHVVPLSRQVRELLEELRTLTGGQEWLFPNYRRPKTCMTITTLNRALERMGFNGKDSMGFSAHGFRATASTILNELGYRPDVIERQLAHKERNKVRASYNRAEYMAERVSMMQEWADLLDAMAKPESNVVAGRFGVSEEA
ncbi:TPA: tyrosine-type recombinase/integrase [Pseudomonas aeruginosa]|uniref:tyrosine-type recombinase/integrase n=1 Tax=Pseudomonas aeruginosa TaxID=287 RepID=UPI0018C64E0C|nr:integrase arm-type DNA-binding domain-containing protein [Pseudomonas aeruginosa]EKI2989562.1 tyrosine-type recombinase/integrase [Pseudomonas aeruginosa]EKV5566718.1 tyrosine-type recombinase/integrase [Pseudomonas aeruginosa]ELJ2627134.1 tyrosine-type recombinase/integrase [Pseudomonas aeruginosa]MBG4963574.1 tyrosine-type recombinase/integrase [Pseudomonas aeruginosa]MBH8631202.1 tyrosine-type recombinase/integrase [Pseudomonas aeruginosa]